MLPAVTRISTSSEPASNTPMSPLFDCLSVTVTRMDPASDGSGVGLGGADEGSSEPLGGADDAADDDGGADEAAVVGSSLDGVGVAELVPPRRPRKTPAATTTTTTAAIPPRTARGMPPPLDAVGAGGGIPAPPAPNPAAPPAASSFAQFLQKTRSGSLGVPHTRQMTAFGMGGCGVSGWVGIGSGAGPGSGPGIGFGCVDVSSGAASPLHSRNDPQLPQNCAPTSFCVPQTLQTITSPPPPVSAVSTAAV